MPECWVSHIEEHCAESVGDAFIAGSEIVLIGVGRKDGLVVVCHVDVLILDGIRIRLGGLGILGIINRGLLIVWIGI